MENKVMLIGTVGSDAEFSHEICGEKFYTFKLEIKRDSGTIDIIPMMISENKYTIKKIKAGKRFDIVGQIRSYDLLTKDKIRLILYVLVTRIVENFTEKDVNHIRLDGYICKEPKYRITPRGREIADVLVAATRPSSRSDYVPLVVWGRNSRIVSNCLIGNCICIEGRVQSRIYIKEINMEQEIRTAYEVSVKNIYTDEM